MTRTCLLCIFPDIGHGFTTVNWGLRINTYMQAFKMFSLSLLPLFTRTLANNKQERDVKAKTDKNWIYKNGILLSGQPFFFPTQFDEHAIKKLPTLFFPCFNINCTLITFLTAKEEMCSQKRSEIGRNSLLLGADKNLSTLIYFCLFFHHPSFIHELCNFSIHNRVFQTILPQPINL